MEFERILQDWTADKEAGVWLSVDVVLQCCPEIEKEDIYKYFILGEGLDPILRGFYHISRRKLDSIFIFNRFKAQLRQLDHKPPEPPDVRAWKEFLSLYTSLDTDSFYEAVFESRTTKLSTYQKEAYSYARWGII